MKHKTKHTYLDLGFVLNIKCVKKIYSKLALTQSHLAK